MNPEVPPRWAEKRHHPVLGAVLIVKNEKQNLPRLLESLRHVADEVVVADTGSTDGTIALCKQWRATLLNVPWRDDFSYARNRSIAGARAKYLLRMDADEVLPEETQAELVRLRDEVLSKESELCAYDFEVWNQDGTEFHNQHMETRIFPNRPDVRYQGTIHEEIASSLARAGIRRIRTGMVVHHRGYEEGDIVAKQVRNEALLRVQLKQDPKNPHVLVHLAQAAAEMKHLPEAEEHFSCALVSMDERGFAPELQAEVHVLRAMIRRHLGRWEPGLFDLEKASALHPTWALPEVMRAEYAIEQNRWEDVGPRVAEAARRELLPGTFAFGLPRARSNLALFEGYVAERSGDHATAEEAYRRAVSLLSESLNARLALGQLLLDQKRFGEAREVLEPAGAREDDEVVQRFVEIACAIALARVGTGEMNSAQACLAPLLDVFAPQLGYAQDVSPVDLVEVVLKGGFGHAAKNLLTVFQLTMEPAA